MKSKIYSIVISLILGGTASSCNNDDPDPFQKDWQGTTDYFASTEASGADTYYRPAAGFVGDPMPFYDPVAGDYKIMYLQDYRPNQVGTYHPIWAVSTKDAASYISMGELISCGKLEEQDAAIGTGSTIWNPVDKLYYTFYTGNKYQPTASDNGQVVMYATSGDFKTWTKNRSFYLKGNTDGYSKSDFRDPFVFEADGEYHMLVSTVKDGKGVLAEYVSDNLKDWTHKGVFMTMMWDRFYECPDVFKMGDWWYLVYSEMHAAVRRVQYFKGRTLDELKAATANDAGIWPDGHEGFLDSRGFYAGKTASDGTDRYIWGWCPTRAGRDNTDVGAAPAEPEWAGNLVAHKVVQHADGTLSLGGVKGISEKYSATCQVKMMASSETGVETGTTGYKLNGNAYVLFNRLENQNKISFTVKTVGHDDKFGFSFARGTDSEKYYTVVVNPEDNGNKRKLNFEEEGVAGKGFIEGIDGYLFDRPSDNTYHVTIYTDNSVCVVYINDNVVYTNRIYGMQKNCWSVNSYSGMVEVSDVTVSSVRN